MYNNPKNVSPPSIKIMYLRDKKGNMVGCVASRRLNRINAPDVLEFELSVRSPLDAFDSYGRPVPFNRQRARDIAIGRLNTHPREIVCPRSHSGEDAAEEILRYLCNASRTDGISDRARKAAQVTHTRNAIRALVRASKSTQEPPPSIALEHM